MNDSTHINVGCGTHRAPAPWINLDLIDSDELNTKPDYVISDAAHPLDAFDAVERVYLGHVLEHFEWDAVVPFLKYLHVHTTDDAEVLAVGPDALRSIRLYGQQSPAVPWNIIEAVIEDADPFVRNEPVIVGQRHCWNSHEQRILRAFEEAGWEYVQAVPMESMMLRPVQPSDWPVVSQVEWQCAVFASKVVF